MKKSILESPQKAAEFWAKVEKTSTCWVWTGYIKDRQGHGEFRGVYVHRLVYENEHGVIPTGWDIHHTCGNAACVRPDHLELMPHGKHTLTNGGVSTKNALKTHCPHGHRYDLINTVFRRGFRECRICREMRADSKGK